MRSERDSALNVLTVVWGQGREEPRMSSGPHLGKTGT